MKISYNWLKQYINIDIEPEKLSTILTDIGLEIEGMDEFQSVKGGLEGVIIGEVVTCDQHTNADKLKVTTVDIGDKNLLPIVCGAPNVAAGQKVVVATPGTTLYSGDDPFVIKKTKIRGEVSEGMICAEDELGLGNSHDGIIVLPPDVEKGMKASEYFRVESDIIFEIGLTPNRSDAISHIGVARDLAAGLNHYFNTDKYTLVVPDVDGFTVDNNDLNIEIVVEDTLACPRYTGVTLTNIKIGESPDWLKIKLNAIGIRPINNVVDITNYVLHETGQPLHAFDADKIAGGKVVVRKTEKNTSFVTLDDIERKLHPQDLMICDVKEGMCIAGVFGGVHSGVTDETTNIFLESACFDSKHVRKTSKRHGLQTDASFRFERGTDPNITEYALKRAAMLMKELAAGIISSQITDIYPDKITPWGVDINFSTVDRLVGEKISRDIIRKILVDLEIKIVEENTESLKVLVPTFKVDVTREVDIVEEILRIYGYNSISIPDKLNSSVSSRPNPDIEKLQNSIADYLVGQGMTEIMNNSLTKAEYIVDNDDFEESNNVNLLNPLSKDLNILRQSLIFGGLETIAYNINRKISNLSLFEFGSIYKYNKTDDKGSIKNYNEEKHLMLFLTGKVDTGSWNKNQKQINIFTITGIVNSLLDKVGLANGLSMTESDSESLEYSLQYNRDKRLIAEVSLISEKLLKRFDINQEVYCADINWTELVNSSNFTDMKYKQVSKFPSVKRDLSLVLDRSVRFNELKEVAFKTERKLLKNVDLFDIYEGSNIPDNKKSYALSFMLLDETKTLTDKVIDKTMKRILRSFEQQFKAQLR